MMATLTLSGSADNAGSVWHVLNERGGKHEALLADFFAAFFCFATAVRFFSHVGFMSAT